MAEPNLHEIWKRRLSSERRKPKDRPVGVSKPGDHSLDETRTEIERDFDRILFSTPVRRLADKTQVFPLDKNDSVRNRLTHSYEVSNLARSFGVGLCYSEPSILGSTMENAERDVPSLLAAIGLVHDLGNPPFGHQGEAAIQRWFIDHKEKILGKTILGQSAGEIETSELLYRDFSLFEGNAQGFRLVTRLQVLDSEYGLDLTYATLAAMMKYPVRSSDIDKNVVAKKKHGFFASEAAIAHEVLEKVGLGYGKRHPLAYIMEACDDIAYVVLDAEDAIKKGLASYSDLITYLLHQAGSDELTKMVADRADAKHKDYREMGTLSPAELNDISMQRFRVFAIGLMLRSATAAYREHLHSFINGIQEQPLLSLSKAEKLRASLKKFSLNHGYTHKSVLALELQGFNTIRGLMDLLWFSINRMAGKSVEEQKQEHPFARYVWTRISENYRRTFDAEKAKNALPLWYVKCQLLTDMVSGMTDSFAISLYDELKALQSNCELD
ncbi:dNTP triphosphohydrolase [Noviherbaspirillum agri]